MEIYEILEKQSCRVQVQAKNKDEMISRLAELAAASDALGDATAETIHTALAEREQQGSTAFGNEIAIPHARIPGMKRFLLYIVSSERGVDFDALDKKRVKLFFVILGPPDVVTDHLKILAFVSRALSHTNLKQELIAARSETALYEAFLRNTQTEHSADRKNRVMKLMIINLYVEEFLYRVLELFIEEGIEGATIVESAGMGQYISNVPLFADFIGFMNESKHKSKTILTMVPEEHVEDLMNGIEEITGDMDKKQGAMVLVLDVAAYRGSMNML
ncbi:MAG: PTS sugar transporter subunit IIA [Spirochaeta sp.]|jgi:PTS system nitrogen regulatory IIA component|nr:PTS sugar transporter subunit IIA [Spirochaeta sp.]